MHLFLFPVNNFFQNFFQERPAQPRRASARFRNMHSSLHFVKPFFRFFKHFPVINIITTLII